MISNPTTGTQKNKKKSGAKESKASPSNTKFVMVTFGRRDKEVVEVFEKEAQDQGLSRSALAREIIRKHFGYASLLT
ncbi:ribbon-helix-helix CopG family protein [Paucimonas lemoignei]|uniref:Ribbon-helix-helix CopG family protein n=1 Tax=Paucimonas lemoignei TaxID=29443 RepID=A0A4R3HRR3_PAULE|nr:ribbon-helix-helix CopG family protein [Paucimonas lemoignei]